LGSFFVRLAFLARVWLCQLDELATTVAHVLVVELAGAHLWLSIPAVVIQVFWSG
jgi:hypothetical protein